MTTNDNPTALVLMIQARANLLSKGKLWQAHMADEELLALVDRWHVVCARKRLGILPTTAADGRSYSA